METLKIASFNVKDNKINMNGGLRPDGVDNSEIVSSLIKNYDLVGTQEFTVNFLKKVMINLADYKTYGDYRYGNLLANMPYNESNSIITNQNVSETQTKKLPWIADNVKDLKCSVVKMSIMPRIATVVVFKTMDGQEMCMVNTHLDYQVKSIQARQLEALKKILLKYQEKYPVILTGDFNMELNEKHFSNFILDVSSFLQPVYIESCSWKSKTGEEKTPDHIFIPKGYSIEDAGVTSSLGASDHDVIYASIRRR